jgi:hypothetical protein
MFLKELLKLLNKIKKCHPESADADVWVEDDYPVNFVGYDKRHKPHRIKLEQ